MVLIEQGYGIIFLDKHVLNKPDYQRRFSDSSYTVDSQCSNRVFYKKLCVRVVWLPFTNLCTHLIQELQFGIQRRTSSQSHALSVNLQAASAENNSMKNIWPFRTFRSLNVTTHSLVKFATITCNNWWIPRF